MDLNYAKLKWNLFKTRFFGEENGAVDLITIVIIIAVVVVLALIFRNQLEALINNLFTQINDNTETVTALPE